VFGLLFLLTDKLAEHWGAALPCFSAAHYLIALYLCMPSILQCVSLGCLRDLVWHFFLAIVLLLAEYFRFLTSQILVASHRFRLAVLSATDCVLAD
jgi:hypothetical protein